MLTRELLAFRRVKGERLRPQFIDPKDEDPLETAAALIDLLQHATGEPRGAIDEAADAIVGEARKVKVARGLYKLLTDRCEWDDPGDAAMATRAAAFQCSAGALQNLSEGSSFRDYLAALEAGLDRPLADVRAHLYDDLPEHRRLLSAKLPTPPALLSRYNLALAQGLVLYAGRLEVKAERPGALELRKLLRWLRFSRLVAEVKRDGDAWELTIEGPAALFDMQKKYGLQLATFLGAVPLLGKYTVEADIDLPRLARGRLYLDHKDPLVALDATALGHIPAEIEAGMGALGDERWQIDPMPELRHVGVSGMCVPDFGLREQASGRTVAVELFHRWHRHALVRRLDELAVRPDPHFFVGVDLALTKDEAIAARVDGHPQVFTFNKFPSRKKLQPLLDRLEQAGPSASP